MQTLVRDEEHPFRPGDIVRVVKADGYHRFAAGSVVTVLRGPEPGTGSWVCRGDIDGAATDQYVPPRCLERVG